MTTLYMQTMTSNNDLCFPGTWPAPELSYFTSSISLILCLIITLGNSLIIISVIKDPFQKLRTPFSYYLVNLSVSDLIVGIMAMPVSVVVHSMEAKRQLNRTSLTILHLTHFISASASMFSLVAMSIDRYFAIETSNVRVKVTNHRCVAISVSTWILAGCFSLLYFIVGFTTFLMIFLNFSFLTCTVLIIITHVKTLRMIKKSGKELGRFACKDRYCDIMQKKKAAEREKKVTKTFVIMLIAFLWSILPAIILASILQFGIQIHCDIRHILRDMSYLIISALSAINPFIYAIRLKQFKKAIYLIIKCAEHRPTTRLHMSSVLELRQTGKSASLDRVESDQGLSSLARTSDS